MVKGHIMAVSDAHVFPGFLESVLSQIFFQSNVSDKFEMVEETLMTRENH